MSGRGIFTSRRRVKCSPRAIIAICMLTSVKKMFIIHTRVASCLFPREVLSDSTFECKVTVGVSGHAADFLLSAKEGQLVQVMVSSYTCPTFVLSVAVVLLVVLLLKSRKSAACLETLRRTLSILIKAHRSC